MTMEKLIPHTTQEGYPKNLLAAVAEDRLEPPASINEDIMAGIRYALSTLEDREQEILNQRFSQNATRPVIGEKLGISQERVRQIENRALRKLRVPSRWNYMKLGVCGYMEKRIRAEYAKGYNLGYKAGYKEGADDAANGRSHSFGKEEELQLPVEVLGLSVRAYNCLIRIGCKTIGDVARISDGQIATARNMGKKSADEIANALKQRGVTHTEWEKYLLDNG